MWRDHVNAVVKAHTGMVVQTGPFEGLRLAEVVCWGDGDISPKLLGTYEQELHGSLKIFAARQYGAVIDVGCAEGYYATGLSLLFPKTPIFAFDTNERAREIAKVNVALNNQEHLVNIGGFCDVENLASLGASYGRSLLIVDCEGYENELFIAEKCLKAIDSFDMIIECHDFIDSQTTSRLFGLLSPTHHIDLIYATGRNPNAFPFLEYMHDNDRWFAVSENRPCRMHWMVCQPKTGSLR